MKTFLFYLYSGEVLTIDAYNLIGAVGLIGIREAEVKAVEVQS